MGNLQVALRFESTANDENNHIFGQMSITTISRLIAVLNMYCFLSNSKYVALHTNMSKALAMPTKRRQLQNA